MSLHLLVVASSCRRSTSHSRMRAGAVVPGHRLDGPEDGRIVEEFCQSRQAHTLHPGTTVLIWLARRRRTIESGIQTQSGDEDHGFPQGLAEVEQVQNGVAAIPHRRQRTVGQPTAQLQDHLTGPVGKLFMRASPALVIPFPSGSGTPGRETTLPGLDTLRPGQPMFVLPPLPGHRHSLGLKDSCQWRLTIIGVMWSDNCYQCLQ